jgi:hypothetical protein
MLSWFAFTFNAARLGLEAQNAAVLRLLRLAGGVSKAAADEILPEQMAVHTEAHPAGGRSRRKGATPVGRSTKNRLRFGSGESGPSEVRTALQLGPSLVPPLQSAASNIEQAEL